jgi:uncharacterized protein YjbJ (UPF0337 family)
MAGERDRTDGTVDELKGKAKEKTGEVMNDDDLEARGKGDQMKGKTEQAVGHAKDAGEKVKEAAKKMMDD